MFNLADLFKEYQKHSDSVDEPLYRNLPSSRSNEVASKVGGGDSGTRADASSVSSPSANGGYENLESVVSSGANNSSTTNIYQNQQVPGKFKVCTVHS